MTSDNTLTYDCFLFFSLNTSDFYYVGNNGNEGMALIVVMVIKLNNNIILCYIFINRTLRGAVGDGLGCGCFPGTDYGAHCGFSPHVWLLDLLGP